MNEKVLKVRLYNLEFGGADRFVNVYGCFKYKPNGNIYLAYSDCDMKYSIIYYGTGHIKGDTLLSMKCRTEEEVEIIKEYLFKKVNRESLDNFELYSLDGVEGIEIIASDKIDIKPEVLVVLNEICFPKKEEVPAEVEQKEKKVKKKVKVPIKVLIVILGAILLVAGLFYFWTLPSKDEIAKSIICERTYQHSVVTAKVQEVNTFYFNVQDSLLEVDNEMLFQFEEKEYENFIQRGQYYKYLPEDDEKIGTGYEQDDTNYTFKTMKKISIDTDYNKPTSYEEIFSYYKAEGYICSEKINEG